MPAQLQSKETQAYKIHDIQSLSRVTHCRNSHQALHVIGLAISVRASSETK